jgi:hypothetical protein
MNGTGVTKCFLSDCIGVSVEDMILAMRSSVNEFQAVFTNVVPGRTLRDQGVIHKYEKSQKVPLIPKSFLLRVLESLVEVTFRESKLSHSKLVKKGPCRNGIKSGFELG